MIRTELYDLLANPDESRCELMSRDLNYLKNFWNQIFAYRNDEEYSIAPSIYNTFIETCKQEGVSFRDYFCRLLREFKKGRTDYENLLPMTIYK